MSSSDVPAPAPVFDSASLPLEHCPPVPSLVVNSDSAVSSLALELPNPAAADAAVAANAAGPARLLSVMDMVRALNSALAPQPAPGLSSANQHPANSQAEAGASAGPTATSVSGRDKGAGKGKGKGKDKGKAMSLAVRHRASKRRNRDNLEGITKPAIRRLARRGGVKRLSGAIYDECRGVLKTFLDTVIRDAAFYTEHARRRTISVQDVIFALKRQGRVLYGFGA
jgi:histone H4